MIRAYCNAKSKRSGRQCRNLPAKGSTVCRYHAGQAEPHGQAQLELLRDQLGLKGRVPPEAADYLREKVF